MGRDCGFKYGSQGRLHKKMSFHCLLTVTVSDEVTPYVFLPMYNVFSYLVRLVPLLPLVICFRNLLAILKCLFFHVNFRVSLSNFNRNSA